MRPRYRSKAINRQDYLKTSIHVMEGSGSLSQKPRPFTQTLAVEKFSSWVYIAAMLNAEAVASVPLRLYVRERPGTKLYRTRGVTRGKRRYLAGDWIKTAAGVKRVGPSKYVRTKIGGMDDFAEVTEPHPVTDLLDQVNPHMNGFDLLTMTMLYLQVTGNAYLHPIMSESLGVPGELWVMPSQWTEIIPDREKFIGGYAYGRDAMNMAKFDPDEVIHVKLPNLADVFYGLSRVEAVWTALGLHESKRDTDTSHFMNRARPDYMVIVKDGAGPEQLDRFENAIETKLRGTRRAGQFIALTGEVQVQQLNYPPDDIGDPDRVIEEIAGGFGVPITKLLANDPNRANAETGDAGWMADTILPYLTMIEQKLNEALLPLFGIEDDAFLAFDNPVPEDRAFDLTRRTQLVSSGLLLIDEARAEDGYEPVEGGAIPRVNGQPIDTIGQVAPPMSINVGERPEPAPMAPVNPSRPVDDVSSTALNGAQLTALQGIVTAWAIGELSRESAIGLASVAFPAVSRDRIEAIFTVPPKPKPVAEPIADDDAKAYKAPEKYDHIDFIPPEGAREEAQRGLDWRREHGRGGTEVGVARARDIARGANLSPETIGRMVSYFARHEVDKQGEGWSPGEDGYPSAGRIAWALWGGDAGRSWAEKVDGQMEAADNGDDKADDAGAGGDDPADGAADSDDGAGAGGDRLAKAADNGGRADQDQAPGGSADRMGGGGTEHGSVGGDRAKSPGGDPDDAAGRPGADAPSCGCVVKGPTLPEDWPDEVKADRKAIEDIAARTGDPETGDADDTVRDEEPATPAMNLMQAIAAEFAEQARLVVAAMPDVKTVRIKDFEAEVLLAIAELERRRQEFADAIANPLIAATAGGAAGGLRRINIDVGFDVINPSVEAAARRHALRLAGDLNQTSLDRLQNSIADGLAGGESTSQLQARVMETFESFSGLRAETIARTESARAYVQGEVEGWRESGVVEGKRWLLAPNACEFCVAAAQAFGQKTSPLDMPFFERGSRLRGVDGGIMKLDYEDVIGAPLHPNCRCDLVPVLRNV